MPRPKRERSPDADWSGDPIKTVAPVVDRDSAAAPTAALLVARARAKHCAAVKLRRLARKHPELQAALAELEAFRQASR